jgi:N-acetylneuraminate synthase/N,N'-diacetyllegionaminate synthase
VDFLPARRPFVIAEAGVNHDGRTDLALKLVDAAADAGADAVKFQTFQAEALVTGAAPQAKYQTRAGKSSQLAMLRALQLSDDGHRAVVRRCRRRKIEFMSTPFDERSADFLDSLGMRIFKVPSGEVTNHPLLAHIARKKKPVILSTGMSTLQEVREAVAVLKKNGARELVVLHCVSSYPARAKDVNLRAMGTLAEALSLPVGYSDHTLGLAVPLAAAALGAQVIEKHFTLDKKLNGPDHAMSLSPAELSALCRGLREVAASLGDGVKRPAASEREIQRVARRSIVLARALPAGSRLSLSDLALKRPGTGLPPAELGKVVGRTLKRDLPADALLSWPLLR